MPSPTCHPAVPCRSPYATYVTHLPAQAQTLLCLQETCHLAGQESKAYKGIPSYPHTPPPTIHNKETEICGSHLTHVFPVPSRNNTTAIMASIVDGLSNLLSSIFEIFQGLINTVLSALQSVFGLFRNLIASVFDMMSGLVGFILGTCSLTLFCVL